MLTRMVREQAGLGVQLLEVGDVRAAREQFEAVLVKLDLVEAASPDHKREAIEA